jgi:hypothetical protein
MAIIHFDSNPDDLPLHELLDLLQSEASAPVFLGPAAEREAIEATIPVLA